MATARTKKWTVARSTASIRHWANVGLDNDDDRLRQVLRDYFAWATTTSMSRYGRAAGDFPEGLDTPQLSWDGLVGAIDRGARRARGDGLEHE